MISLQMYKVLITDYFKKQLKGLVKKDFHLKENLKEELINFSKQRAISIGSGVYKVRISRQNQGKSGGYRVYIFVIEIQNILTPICIYSKNQKENLTYEELMLHLRKTKGELMKLLS